MKAMGKLDGKIAVITGGTSGIGAASAIKFALEGAEVVLVARGAERGLEIQEKIISSGGKASFFPCDVTKKADIAALYDHVKETYGCLDILFNNAGVLYTNALEDITDEEWDATYEANVKSTLHMCQAFVGMLRGSGGVILNNASINGLHSYIKGKRSYMYATSKSALIQLTRYLAKNYAPEIRVNALCPGMTMTNLFTNREFSRFMDCNLLNRIADPEEIANVALFLASPDSSFVTGAIIVADGGETIK